MASEEEGSSVKDALHRFKWDILKWLFICFLIQDIIIIGWVIYFIK